MTEPQITPPTEDLDAPFTEEQLKWLSAREHMLSAHGTRYSRSHLRRYARAALAGFVALAIGLGLAVHAQGVDSRQQRAAIKDSGRAAAGAVVDSGRAVAVSGCNRDFTSAIRLRGLLSASEKATTRAHAKGQMSDEQFQDAKAFYEKQLNGLPLPDCRAAAQILTADPHARIVIPTPRYPGDQINARTGG